MACHPVVGPRGCPREADGETGDPGSARQGIQDDRDACATRVERALGVEEVPRPQAVLTRHGSEKVLSTRALDRYGPNAARPIPRQQCREHHGAEPTVAVVESYQAVYVDRASRRSHACPIWRISAGWTMRCSNGPISAMYVAPNLPRSLTQTPICPR